MEYDIPYCVIVQRVVCNAHHLMNVAGMDYILLRVFADSVLVIAEALLDQQLATHVFLTTF